MEKFYLGDTIGARGCYKDELEQCHNKDHE